MTRITTGGLVAGVIMFLWSFLAHMVLPVGYMGISASPGEDAVLAALRANANGSGMYLMPGNDYFQSLSKSNAEQQAAMKAMTEKAKSSGFAFIVYHPDGGPEIGAQTLGLQLLSQVIVCWIFAFALWAALPRVRSFGMRVWLITIMGLLPFVGCDFPYWNWYGFPGAYMMGKIMDYGIGAVLAGVFLAWWFGRGEQPQREAARMAA